MGPKKRDKVPVRRPQTSFSIAIPLGTSTLYSHMKAAIGRRMKNGMPRGLPSADELRNKARIEREKGKEGTSPGM